MKVLGSQNQGYMEEGIHLPIAKKSKVAFRVPSFYAKDQQIPENQLKSLFGSCNVFYAWALLCQLGFADSKHTA